MTFHRFALHTGALTTSNYSERRVVNQSLHDPYSDTARPCTTNTGGDGDIKGRLPSSHAAAEPRCDVGATHARDAGLFLWHGKERSRSSPRFLISPSSSTPASSATRGEGVSKVLILDQRGRPNSYRLMKSPSTRSCMRSVFEKPIVRRTNRLIRVRRLMCLLSIVCVLAFPTSCCAASRWRS